MKRPARWNGSKTTGPRLKGNWWWYAMVGRYKW